MSRYRAGVGRHNKLVKIKLEPLRKHKMAPVWKVAVAAYLLSDSHRNVWDLWDAVSYGYRYTYDTCINWNEV